MSNKGANTNKSQFFITFSDCQYLDKKYTIFGRVVGGLNCLEAIEARLVDLTQKPVKDIKIISTIVYTNAYRQVIQEIMGKKNKKDQKSADVDANERWVNPRVDSSDTTVGKYIGK